MHLFEFQQKIVLTAGCLLGDPEGENVYIDGVVPARVISSEFMAKSPEKLALNLLGVFFTQDQLTKGNCTPTPDHKDLLDPRIINGIRCKCILCNNLFTRVCIYHLLMTQFFFSAPEV